LEARHGAGQAGHIQGYEGTDTSVHNVALLAGAFVGLLIFGFIVGYGTFKILSLEEGTVSAPPGLVQTGRVLPPAPRLQVEAHKDLTSYLKDQLTGGLTRKRALSEYRLTVPWTFCWRRVCRYGRNRPEGRLPRRQRPRRALASRRLLPQGRLRRVLIRAVDPTIARK